MDVVDSLMKAGFTRHEATLYLTLCNEGDLTGYEAAKLASIPRSNAYLGLAGLVEKGAALRIDGDASKYSAVHPSELVCNLRKRLEEAYRNIEERITVREAVREPYFTIAGKKNVIDKMSYMIKYASDRIYISTSPKELELVESELKDAAARGLKVVIITEGGYFLDKAIIHQNRKQPGQVRLIVDTAHVLTGEINDSAESTCLYSKNRNLIDLIKDSLTNEIKLIQIQGMKGADFK